MKRILIVDDKGCENLYVVGTGKFEGEKTLPFQELHLPSDVREVIEWYKKKYPYSNGSYGAWYSKIELDAVDTFQYLQELMKGDEE